MRNTNGVITTVSCDHSQPSRGQNSCRECNRRYQREYRRTHPKFVEWNRELGRARNRAVSRLIAAHKAEYEQLLEEERPRP